MKRKRRHHVSKVTAGNVPLAKNVGRLMQSSIKHFKT